MNEEIKTKLQQALNEPAVPEELISRTIRRCQMVTASRRAEETLALKGNAISVEERRSLAAESILGRLAQQNEVPEQLNVQRLVKDPRFCRVVDRPADQLLKGLREGTILRELASGNPAPARQQGKALRQDQPTRKAPEAPVKKAPGRFGPMM